MLGSWLSLRMPCNIPILHTTKDHSLPFNKKTPLVHILNKTHAIHTVPNSQITLSRHLNQTISTLEVVD